MFLAESTDRSFHFRPDCHCVKYELYLHKKLCECAAWKLQKIKRWIYSNWILAADGHFMWSGLLRFWKGAEILAALLVMNRKCAQKPNLNDVICAMQIVLCFVNMAQSIIRHISIERRRVCWKEWFTFKWSFKYGTAISLHWSPG